MNAAYKYTVFQALPETLPDAFCVVTAWNPDGQSDLPGRNHQRDADLAARIDAAGLKRVRITGLSPNGEHAEPGWAIDCSLEKGLALAREFAQEALYRVADGELTLVACADGDTTSLGPFGPRLRDPRNQRWFTVHVGCRQPRARLLPTEALEVRIRAGSRFPKFTVTGGERHDRNQAEDLLLISVVTDQPSEVLALAEELRRHLDQDDVGVSHNGVYQRVAAWSDHEFILSAWGLGGELPASSSFGRSPASSPTHQS